MTPDEQLRQLAARQHAHVALEQAHTLMRSRELQARLRGPDWELTTDRVMRLVGAPVHPVEPLVVAVLDAGHGAVASYAAAAAVWQLPGFPLGPIELSRERGRSGRRPSLGRIHDHRSLPAHHTTIVRGVPVTTLPRTIFDLAGRLHPARTERIVASVIGKSPGTLRVLHRLLPELAERGRNGIVVMRELLDRYPIGCVVEETGLERRVNHILREGGEAPMIPQVNIGGHEWIGRVDLRDSVVPNLLWEVDSQLHHSSPLDVANDAARDEAMAAIGLIVKRIPEEHVWYDPPRVLRTVREARARFASTSVTETGVLLLAKR
jgi:hypothetical protein